MSVNKKYFFLRLKENYFEQDAIVLLESMPDGILYSNILLKLYLKSLKHDGKLQLDEGIPLTTPMLAALFRQQVGTIEHALKIFAELGLVERLDNGVLYMTNIELLVGQSSTEGERKRRARKALQGNPQALPEAGADICPPELEREKELELELEPELEREREKAPEALPPARALLGKYHNVSLSSAELDALKRDLPEKWQYYIDRLSCHMASSGKTYQNHAATIYKWAQEDAAKAPPAAKTRGTAQREYTYEAGESL